MSYLWERVTVESRDVEQLVRELGISSLTARLLCNRGLARPEQAYRFLNPRLQDLHDPFQMADMEPAVQRIFRALEAREKILIYGDYDVDGITSTVALRRALEMLGGSVDFYIPRRLEEGYGLQPEVLKQYAGRGFSLAISVDSGIRAFEACEAARQMGLDLIVTDHHLPDSRLPGAYAILNPKRGDCPYPDKNLAAAGVTLKLIQALFGRAGREGAVAHFLKIVAIGTVADMVPLVGENRIIVRFGLQALSQPHNLGLQALLQGAGVGPEVSHFDVGFKLAPRINAVTRMGGGREVVDLFSADDPAVAGAIVEEMNVKNSLRRREEEKILAEIESRIHQTPAEFDRKFLVVAGREWHRGVIGIVASRIAERFYRPTLVLSSDGVTCQGSGRSIPGFHMLDTLDACRELFSRYGGHAQAVGCTLEGGLATMEGVTKLAARLDELAGERLSAQQLIPRLRIDGELSMDLLCDQLYDDLDQMAPFGHGNPLPVFASRGVSIADGPWVLKEKHLKFRVQSGEGLLDVIWWKHGRAAGTLSAQSRLDLAFTLSRDRFQGRERLVLTLRDLEACPSKHNGHRLS